MFTEDQDPGQSPEEKLLELNRMGSKMAKSLGRVCGSILLVMKSLVLPHTSEFDRRKTVVMLFRFLTSHTLLLLLIKSLQVFWNVTNFMLLLSLGSLIPFFHSMFSIIRVIPCPRMAAFVSNTALFGAFVALFLVAYILYGNLWVTYSYLMTIWPWIAIGTLLARLHIGRDREVTHFSPLVHLPILAILGAGSMIGMLTALKDLSIIDCAALAFIDPIWSAAFHALLVQRVSYFEKHAKFFALSIILVVAYIYGQAYSGGVVRSYMDSVTFMTISNTMPAKTYILFLGSRAAWLLRCSYIKKSFLPVEVNQLQEFKSLFPSFPFPIRFRLDAMFDSGLVEDSPHAIGPTGTRDMYLLTDNLYMLPLASVTSWLVENLHEDTLHFGVSATSAISGTPADGFRYFIIILFVIAIALTPTATSKILFDRGSSPHSWIMPPVLVQLSFVAVDILYLNPNISRFQIVCIAALSGLTLNFRTDLWLNFKKRYYVSSMKELEFLQPSCLRDAQKQMLSDAVEQTGVEDFGTLLLETSIHHGHNIQEYFNRKNATKVWDPNPAARAAWKLAGSLVLRAIRHRKEQDQTIKTQKRKDNDFVAAVVDSMVSNASSRMRRN